MSRALWLPDVLRSAGLKVTLEPGWETRGDEGGPVEGVILHHTAGPATGNAPSLRTVRDGRPDLRGPLSCAVLARDGTWIIVSCGRANHAGAGNWNGITDGNGRFLGVEAEATGTSSWPDIQMDSYRRGVAAILRKIGKGAGWAAGHKEYALPRGRKPDPNFDMAAFRASVDHLLRGTATQKPPTPRPPEDTVFTPDPRPTVMVVSAYNGQPLDLPDLGKEGDVVLTYPADGGADQRIWLDPQGTDVDVLFGRTLAMDAWYVTPNLPAEGEPVRVFRRHGGPQQRWHMENLDVADHAFIHSASGLALTVVPGRPARVVLAKRDKSLITQRFRLVGTV